MKLKSIFIGNHHKVSVYLMAFSILGIVSICVASCNIRPRTIRNTKIESNLFSIEFYLPEAMQFVDSSIDYSGMAVSKINYFRSKNDTNCRLFVKYEFKDLAVGKYQDCDLNCIFTGMVANNKEMLFPETQYNYMTSQNGRMFGRLHYRMPDKKYIDDQMITLVHNMLITIHTSSYGYSENDTMKYSLERDSIFNSVKINTK